jgi:hypothetical protein
MVGGHLPALARPRILIARLEQYREDVHGQRLCEIWAKPLETAASNAESCHAAKVDPCYITGRCQ